jgi:hypothetical protein
MNRNEYDIFSSSVPGTAGKFAETVRGSNARRSFETMEPGDTLNIVRRVRPQIAEIVEKHTMASKRLNVVLHSGGSAKRKTARGRPARNGERTEDGLLRPTVRP